MTNRGRIFLVALFFSLPLLAEETRDVGVLGIDDKHSIRFVDLSKRDPDADTPFLYGYGGFPGYPPPPVKVGYKYLATFGGKDNGSLTSIIIDGVAYKTPLAMTFQADHKPAPDGGHWEWKNGQATLMPGAKDRHRWKGNNGSLPKDYENVPYCHDTLPFSDATEHVVVTVKPAAGQKWKFDEAPSVVAEHYIAQLNENDKSIKFVEANGVAPEYVFDITLSETNDGTQRNTADVRITAPTMDPSLELKSVSGDAPYSSWNDAIDHLATNTLQWFEQGWNTKRPCRQMDGTISR